MSWHRRVALVFAPLLLLQALTGALLLFKEPLARIIDPAGMEVSGNGARPAEVSLLLAKASSIDPDYRVARLFLPQNERATVFAQLNDAAGRTHYASLDPSTGAVLAFGTVWRFPLEAALQLHYRLMDGTAGLAIVLGNGIALIWLAGTGLMTWRPARGRILKSLAIRGNLPARIKLRQFHRSAGVLVSIVVLFSAVSGILLAYPDLADAGSAPQGLAVEPYNSAQVDAAIALASSRFPEARIRDIRFPLADRLDINFFAPERNPRAVHVVSVAPKHRRIIRVIPAHQNDEVWMTVLPLHTGDSFGLAGRILLLAEAAALAFLAVSGPIMWWRARKGIRSKRKAS